MPLICPNPQDQYSESCLSRILQRMEGIYQHNWLEIVCICPSTWNQGSQISGSPPTRLLSVYSWGGWPQYNVMKSLLIFCHVTSEQLLKVTRAYAEWAIKNYHVSLWLYLPSFQWWRPATTLPFCLVGKTLVISIQPHPTYPPTSKICRVELCTELFYAIIPTLFLCFLLICYPYILLHF